MSTVTTSRKRRGKEGARHETLRPAVTRRIHMSRIAGHQGADLQLFARGPHPGLRVAVYPNFYPVAYRDEKTREFSGIDIDILSGFSKAVGLAAPRYLPSSEYFDLWDRPAAWGNAVDVAIGGVGRTTWRESQGIEWTIPYFTVRRTLVYRLADPVARFPEDVTGQVTGTMGSTGMVDAMRRMRAAGKGHLLLIRHETDARDLRDLMAGKIQGLMRGSFVGAALVAKHPKVLGLTKFWDASASDLWAGGEIFSFPCRRGSGLAGALNTYLLQLSASGGLARLITKHHMHA